MKTKNDTKDRFVIIMAGGRGERFWPLSREKMPKQLLTLLGKRSFLQQAVDRVLPLVPAKNIFVITNEAQLPEVRKQLPKIPKSNLVAEPVGRDTCAAVTLGAAWSARVPRRASWRFCPPTTSFPMKRSFSRFWATHSIWPAAAGRL